MSATEYSFPRGLELLEPLAFINWIGVELGLDYASHSAIRSATSFLA